MLWKMVIRPPRDLYAPDELGPVKFRLGKRVYERHDLQLQGVRGILECSHFCPSKSAQASRPCVVYLHGNCSSRLEAFDALPVLLPRDMTVFCLDLSGSGRSDGEYISLGYHEEKDLRVVLQHLRSLPSVSSIGLWGRSMGATTSILRAAEDPEIAGCILDSAFGDLKEVAEELVNRGRFKVPQFLVNMAFEMVRSEVITRAAFDPVDLVPINCAPKARCPAMFGVAADDSFVLPHHTQDLHNSWAGERLLRVFDGGHNGVRPSWFLEEAADFLVAKLRRQGGDRRATPSVPASAGDDEVEGGASSSSQNENSPWAPLERNPQDAEVKVGSMGISVEDVNSPDPAVRRRAMAKELTKMGFHGEVSAQAAARCSTLDEAVDWLLKKPDVFCKFEPSAPQGRVAPSSDGGASSSTSAVNDAQREGVDVSANVPGANLEEQLRFLGFDKLKAKVAASQCQTLEGAADWLTAQNAMVKL